MTEACPVRLRQCVILVGGMGMRLGALTTDTPKPMLEIGGRPFLAWLLRELSRYGFEEALLLTGHLSDTLCSRLDDLAAGLPRPMKLVVSAEPSRAGTGGALFHARSLLEARFLLCNGDSLLDANLAPLLAAASADGPEIVGRLLLHPTQDTSRCGVVATTAEVVTGFHDRPSPTSPDPHDIYAGIAVFRRELVHRLCETCSLERDVLPGLAAAGVLRAHQAQGYFIDIGIREDLDRARRDLPPRLHRRALFLDRDGVINIDHGHVGSRDRFDFTQTALQAVAAATDAGWHVFIVTNQSGVARGYYTEAAVQSLLAWVQDQAVAAGGTIDDTRYCPTHPHGTVAAYAVVSDWRKPAPGMLLDLIRAWELDPARCVMVGDQPTDLAAAAAAGVPGYLFSGGDLLEFVTPLLAENSA